MPELSKWINTVVVISLGERNIPVETGELGTIVQGPRYAIGKTPEAFAKMCVPVSSECVAEVRPYKE